MGALLDLGNVWNCNLKLCNLGDKNMADNFVAAKNRHFLQCSASKIAVAKINGW